MSCIICCDDYTDILRRPIKCPGCKKEVCLICFKRHLLDNRNLQCMFPDCDKTFSFPEISRLTGNIKFSNEIMDKLGFFALEEEKNFLPQRQKVAKRILEEQKYELRRIERNKLRNEINKERWNLESKMRKDITDDKILLDINNKINKLRDQYNVRRNLLYAELNKEIKPYLDNIKDIDLEDRKDREQLGIMDKKENKYTFVKQCSFENCKGFLENNEGEKGWKCSLCDRFTCRKCHEPLVSKIDEATDKKIKHECNEDIVANLKEMKKDTKPCPKCGTAIFKIDGCFSPETKMLMFDGQIKEAKNINIGDKLIGLDLQPRTVLKTCNGEDDMYLIKQTKGVNYIVNSEHTLLLKNTNCYLMHSEHCHSYRIYYNIEKYKDFNGENLTEAYEFLKVKKEEVIEITVKDYLKLNQDIKIFLKGIKLSSELTKYNLTDIEVIHLGKGKYNGFMVDKDNKFVLTDFTIVKNCSMMFCIGCQTYFDWNSGKIYKRGGHNPDAVRWMRENGNVIRREEGDDGCTDPFVNNYIYYNWTMNVARPYLKNNNNIFNTIMNLIDYGTHISQVVVPRFNNHYNQKAEDLAVKYLINEDYNEDNWAKDIRKIKKQQMFNQEFRNIITLLLEVMRTVLFNLREMITRKESAENIIKQLELIPQIALECNQKFEDIKKCFNSKRKNKFNIIRDNKDYLFELNYS